MPWVCCAFGNVYSTIFGLLVRSKTDNTWTSLLLSALLGLHIFWFWPIGRGEGSATFQSSHRQPNRCLVAPPCPVGVDALPAPGLIDHIEQKTSGEVLAGCGDVLSVTSCRLPSSVVVVWSWRRGIYCFSHRLVTTISETKQRHWLHLFSSLMIMSQ